MSNERTGVLELTLGDTYIGSAYSPQVEVTDTATGHEVAITYMSPEGITTERFDVADGEQGPQGPAGYSPTVTITDTPTGHTVTITDEDGPHSYDVPNYAQEEQQRQTAWDALSGDVTDAITAAESATSAASTAAQSATGAASSATSAAQAANTAASSATTAASSANAAATAANSAATAAGTAADEATTAAGDATDAASAANTAAQAAQEAAKGISRASNALMGDPSESTWAQRESTGSGMARVESVQGATMVQDNKLVPVRIAGIASTDAQGGELDSVEWSAQTLRAVGSVRDELTDGELVTRVGVVDLGTAEWSQYNASDYPQIWTVVLDGRAEYETLNDTSLVKQTAWATFRDNTDADTFYWYTTGTSSANSNKFMVSSGAYIGKTAEQMAELFAGRTVLYIKTPTVTPISPALPMSYKVEQGGTESIIVPDGEVSAAPVLTVAEGESAGELVMDALACIAAPDGPVATANHAINTYLTMRGKLYKVTTAIASGETITAGTNVIQTTVMDELIARTA